MAAGFLDKQERAAFVNTPNMVGRADCICGCESGTPYPTHLPAVHSAVPAKTMAAPSQFGYTALLEACEFPGRAGTVQVLLNLGADPRITQGSQVGWPGPCKHLPAS